MVANSSNGSQPVDRSLTLEGEWERLLRVALRGGAGRSPAEILSFRRAFFGGAMHVLGVILSDTLGDSVVRAALEKMTDEAAEEIGAVFAKVRDGVKDDCDCDACVLRRKAEAAFKDGSSEALASLTESAVEDVKRQAKAQGFADITDEEARMIAGLATSILKRGGVGVVTMDKPKDPGKPNGQVH